MVAIDPINYIEIHDNRPVIVGTGLKVAFIANMYVHRAISIDWIVENYDITPAQVHAALSYYYDHAEALDHYIREGDELAQKHGISADDALREMDERRK